MIKDHVKEALELFSSGFNCSQSVLAAFSDEFGLPKEIALKIACPFGGGIGGYGKTCGGLTGAILVIGLKYGADKTTDAEAKKISRDKTRELIEIFEKEHGSCNCNDLVGFDRSNLTGADLMEKIPYFHKTCPKFLETVVSYLEEEL